MNSLVFDIDVSLPDFEFLQKFRIQISRLIKETESQWDINSSTRHSYNLLEDLILWNCGGANLDEIKRNSKILKGRSLESLRSRYRYYISFLKTKEMKIIAAEIIKNINSFKSAFITFNGEKNNRKFLGISFSNNGRKDNFLKKASDSFEEEIENQNLKPESTISSLIEESKIKENNDECQLKKEYIGKTNICTSKNLKNTSNENISEFKCYHSFIEYDKNKLILSNEINENKVLYNHFPMVLMRNFLKGDRIVTREESQIEIKSFFDTIKARFGKEKDEILTDLLKLSGSFQSLVEYYIDPIQNDYLIWTEEEDKALKDNNEKLMRLLIRYKGKEKIEERATFLGIKSELKMQ